MTHKRVTKATLENLAERVCRATEQAYEAAGEWLILDHTDGSARLVDREQALAAAQAWQEIGAMVGRDRWRAQPGHAFAAMQHAQDALYALAVSVEAWGQRDDALAESEAERAEWFVGACAERVANAQGGAHASAGGR